MSHDHDHHHTGAGTTLILATLLTLGFAAVEAGVGMMAGGMMDCPMIKGGMMGGGMGMMGPGMPGSDDMMARRMEMMEKRMDMMQMMTQKNMGMPQAAPASPTK